VNSCSSRKQSGLAFLFESEALAVDANNDRVVQDAIEHRRAVSTLSPAKAVSQPPKVRLEVRIIEPRS